MQRPCPASVFCLLSFLCVSGFIDSACAVLYGPYSTTEFGPSNVGTVNALPQGNKCNWVDHLNIRSNISTYAQPICVLDYPSEYTCFIQIFNYGITSTLTSTVRGVPLVASGIVGVTAKVAASNEHETDINKDPNSFYRGTLVIESLIRTANDLTSVVIPADSSPTIFDIGGPSNLWGESLTPDQVRNIGFGTAFSFAGTGDGTGNAQKVRLHFVGIIVTWTMPAVNIESISPATGSAAGGTPVTVVSTTPSFIDLTPHTGELTPLCRFGSVSVPATIVNDQSLTCISPQGSGTNSFEISLDGVTFTSDGETFMYDLQVSTGIRSMTSAEGWSSSVLSSGAPSTSAQLSSTSFTGASATTSISFPTLATASAPKPTASSSPQQSAAAATTSGIVQARSTESGSTVVMIVVIFIAIVCLIAAVAVVAMIVIRQRRQSYSLNEIAVSSTAKQLAGSSNSPYSSVSVGSQAYASLSCLPIDHANSTRSYSASSTYDTMPRPDESAAPLKTSLPVLPPPVPYHSTTLVMKALHTPEESTELGVYAAMPAGAHETPRKHTQ